MPQAKPSNTVYKGADILYQFIGTLLLHKAAVDFIREHKPWRGIDRLGWVLWVMVIAGALLSFQFYQEFYHAVQQVSSGQQAFTSSMASMFSLEKMQWAMQGSRKYLVIIALELLVFYFIQKTLEILTGRKPELTTQAFVDAELRVLKVTILAFVLERITRFLVVNLALGIVGFDWLDKPVGFLIQCYFLGFALVDNYQECFDMKVAESEKRTRKEAIGVAIATGLVAQLLMYVPLIGAVVATMVGAVAATLAMDRFAPVSQEEHLAIIAEQSKMSERRHRGGVRQ